MTNAIRPDIPPAMPPSAMPPDGHGQDSHGQRRFGRINRLGLLTLIEREVLRFLVVWTQTLLAPLVTAALFLAVFALAIGPARGDVRGVPFLDFLAPGILMMTVIQNAFANTSSSLLISKVQGNIVDTLMPPLSPAELMVGYLVGALARGLAIGGLVVAGLWLGLRIVPVSPGWTLAFIVLGALMLGAAGIVAGIWAGRFDQMAALTNFVVVPLSFLSGTFYSVDSLPQALQLVTRFNPVFYLIDGVRHGMTGVSDALPLHGLLICIATVMALAGLGWHWFRRGYRLKP